MKISEIIEKNKKSIILVHILIPEGNNRNKVNIRGTGFIVSEDGKFLTCAHVYKKTPADKLKYLGVNVPDRTNEKGITYYKKYGLELLGIDEENDVALMKIIADGVKFQPVQGLGDSKSVAEGDELIFLGYPLAAELLNMRFGITMSTNHCIISSVKRRGKDGSLHFFMIDTHINKGSSGSPVFLRDTGEIIGVASGRISSKIPLPDGKIADIPANMGICRPINYAIDLIN